MKNFDKVFNTGNQKKDAKIMKALENGFGAENYEAMMAESKSSSLVDLPKAQLAFTTSYMVVYGAVAGNEMYIFKLSDIKNVYSSNCFFGNYDYDFKAIAVELEAGTFYVAKCMKKQKVDEYFKAISIVEDRCKDNEGSLIA